MENNLTHRVLCVHALSVSSSRGIKSHFFIIVVVCAMFFFVRSVLLEVCQEVTHVNNARVWYGLTPTRV